MVGVAELRNCPKCGRVFTYQARNLCPRCLEEEDKMYDIVRKYVRDHSGATVLEVAEATGVDEEIILHFLREGRLHSKGMVEAAALECARCGKKISAGRYCQECLVKLSKELNRAAGAEEKQEPPATQPPRRSPRDRWHSERDVN